MVYKNVMVDINESKESIKAAERAINIAKMYDSNLYAVTVFDIPDIQRLMPQDDTFNLINLEDYIQQIKNRLSQISEDAKDRKVKIKTMVLDENLRPEHSILYFAKEKAIDLIIVGKGKGLDKNVRDLLLGSTALSIAKSAHCDVLLVS